MTGYTDTTTALEILESLDFEYVPRCESRRVECGKPATHALTESCGCVGLLCDKHTARAVERSASKTRQFFCPICHAEPVDIVRVGRIDA